MFLNWASNYHSSVYYTKVVSRNVDQYRNNIFTLTVTYVHIRSHVHTRVPTHTHERACVNVCFWVVWIISHVLACFDKNEAPLLELIQYGFVKVFVTSLEESSQSYISTAQGKWNACIWENVSCHEIQQWNCLLTIFPQNKRKQKKTQRECSISTRKKSKSILLRAIIRFKSGNKDKENIFAKSKHPFFKQSTNL